jgi:hypothetical protein
MSDAYFRSFVDAAIRSAESRWTHPITGHKFPPDRCGPNGFGDKRCKFVGPGLLWMVFSSPGCDCDQCRSNAEAVRLMCIAIAGHRDGR